MVEPVKPVFRMTMLIAIYVLSTWAGTVDNAEAQVNPDISLTCSPTAIEIDVAPGDTRIGTTYCDASNPTLYVEKVNIQITAAGLTYSAPGSITVAAGDTTTFEVVVRGEDQMTEGSRQVTVSGWGITGRPPTRWSSDGFLHAFERLTRCELD